MKKLLLLGFTLFSTFLFSQAPANDNCSGAVNLGTLGNPGACGTGVKNGTTATVTGTLNNATPENPYTTQGPCSGGTMATPANDIWYSFTMPANGYQVKIVISGAAFTPNIALWTGGCAGLTGRGCVLGTAGAATLTVPGLTPGQTYLIQLSGNTGQSGAFTMAVNAFQDCANCNVGSSLTVSPLPTSGMYQPGQTVSFCYHISQYNQPNTNWLHGVQVTFGAGWNAASITATPPPACVAGGTWLWMPTGEGTVNGTNWGEGFYYDLNNDGNPANNFGDDCTSTTAGQWNFCITLTVGTACNPGADLSVIFNSSGDGESGSWTNSGCASDPATNFNAVQSCCPPNLTVTNLLCNGVANGSATATAVTGAAGVQNPYVFSWTGGATATNTVTTGTSNTLPNLPAGAYTVTITDKNLCSATKTITITQPTSMTVTTAPTSASCVGKGSITTTASGGTPPYTFSWTGPSAYTSATQSPTNLNPGTYSLTVTDHNNCTYTTTTTIAQTGSITVTATSTSVCAGSSGTITGGGATSYTWSNGATTPSISLSPTSTTSYTVIGASGTCTNSAVGTISITPSPTITVNSATVCPGGVANLVASGATTYTWNTGANGNSITVTPGTTTIYTVTGTSSGCTGTATSTVTIGGSISVSVNSATICAGNNAVLTASGGTTYTWTPAATLSSGTGTSVTATPATTTSYTITGATGACTGTTTATVLVNPKPTISTTSNTICIGNSGAITASGASTYTWTPAGSLSPSTGPSVTANPTSTTNYTVTGTDANGCVNTATASVQVNPLPTVTINTPTICAGNSDVLTAGGASTYSWSTGSTTNPITVTPAGNTTYTVTGTDANNCSNTAVGTVSVSASVTLTVNDPIICIGSTTTLTASGANTYTWNTGSNAPTISVSPTVTTSYTVSGTQNGCIGSNTGTVTVIASPTITVSSATICVGSSTTLTATGASQYTWTPTTGLSPTTGSVVTANPAVTTTYTVLASAGSCTTSSTGSVTVNPLPTITVNSSTICAGQQTATLTASGAGSGTYSWNPTTGLNPSTGSTVNGTPTVTTNYTVTGTDANGCVNTATSTITVNNIPIVTATSVSVCPGFAGTITASGANTYTWSNSTPGATLTATPLTTTSYTVTGTDNNTCTNTAVGTITVYNTIAVTVNSATICAGSTATLTANGTSNYSWNPITGLSPSTGGTVTASPATTTIYTVTGTVGTCSATATTTVTVNPLPVLTVNSATICVGQQTATLTVNGLGAGGVCIWNPTTGLSPTTGTMVTGTPTVTTSYSITGTDANGCVGTATSSIHVNNLPIVTATSTSVCPNTAGTIFAGGATTYSWNNSTSGPSLTATPASTTSYVVTGTDNNNCTNTAVGTITVYPTFSVTVNSETICGAGQQTATLTAHGASTYVWSPATNLSATTGDSVYAVPPTTTVYSVIGTSAVGSCTAAASSTVNVSALPQPTVSVNTPCETEQSLNLTSMPAGLSYEWNGPNMFNSTLQNPTIPIANVTQSVAGLYTLIVVDNVTNCINTATINVIVNPKPVITASGSTVCVGQIATLSSSGAGANGAYSWNTGSGLPSGSSQQNPSITTSTMSSATDIAPGTYQYNVVGTDANGCYSAAGAQIVVNSLPVVSATSSTICLGSVTTLTASGAATYVWNTGTTGALLTQSPTSPGSTTYTVTGTDGNNCVNTAIGIILTNGLPVVTITPGLVDCIPLVVSYTATSSPAALSYSWDLGNGPAIVTTTPAGSGTSSITTTYTAPALYHITVTATDINTCVNTASTTATALSLPVADFSYGPQPVSVLTPQVQFTNQSTPGLIGYNWDFGDTYGSDTSSLINPSHTYNDAGTYTVTLTVYAAHCSATYTNTVIINEDYAIYVPNAFTPNEDGNNEIFKPVGEGIKDYKLFIFDRWGSLIFYSEDINKGWDGRYQAKGSDVLQQDVYVWKIQLKDFQNYSKDLSGTVTLLK